MAAYYNEIDPYAAAWLRNLIAAGLIPAGDVDTRSIVDVEPADLVGYEQCHFFAGIGGWAYAARLAGWPDDRVLWTGSCPCQPFSTAGNGGGQADARHLWPEFFRLIRKQRPVVVMGEQVAAAVGKDWLDGVQSDLEGIAYAFGAAVIPACAVNAPHRRDRLWFVADSSGLDERPGDAVPVERQEPQSGDGSVPSALGDPEGFRLQSRRGPNSQGYWEAPIGAAYRSDDDNVADASGSGLPQREREARDIGEDRGCAEGQDAAYDDPAPAYAFGGLQRQVGCHATSDLEKDRGWPGNWNGDGGPAYVAGADGKARRVEPGIRLLAHGVPARVGKLRAYGNAIVPQVAAEVIAAFMETRVA